MLYITIIIISLALSFFFSGTETAFVTVNKVRVELWRRHNDRAVDIVLHFLKNPEIFLYTTLIGNNIFNVAFASFATIVFREYLSLQVSWLVMVLVTLLVGEIIPKTVFASLAVWLVRKIAYPLKFFYYLFIPLIVLVSKISERLLALFGYQKDELKLFFTKKDLEILLQESQDILSLQDEVKGEVFSGILTLKELRVREAMVVRANMIAVPENTSLAEIKKVFKRHGHTKIPVYAGNPDNITGVVFLKELFLEPENFKEMIRPVLLVPETKRCSELLSEFREKNTTIAIVIDEYGGTAGLITTEDLVEELFGEIEDEDDEQENLIRQIDERTYSVNAAIEVEKLNAELNISIPEGDYETLAGFLLSQMQRIPRRDESLEYQDIKIVITSATRRKIQSVKITLSG